MTKGRSNLSIRSILASALPALVLIACSSPSNLARTPAGGTLALANAAVETFEPESLREELLLIQPSFRPPAAKPAETPVPTDTVPAMTDPMFRVQVMALSNETSARMIAKRLQQRLRVPVVVDPHKELFLVRAGAFNDEEEAETLRAEIAAALGAFKSAYVVQVRELAETVVDEDPPGKEVEEVLPSRSQDMVREFGWRVLLRQFLVHEKARNFRLRAQQDLRRTDIDVTFKEPYYKVELGNFRDESDAQLLVEKIRNRGYPYNNALKVRSEILVPSDSR